MTEMTPPVIDNRADAELAEAEENWDSEGGTIDPDARPPSGGR